MTSPCNLEESASHPSPPPWRGSPSILNALADAQQEGSQAKPLLPLHPRKVSTTNLRLLARRLHRPPPRGIRSAHAPFLPQDYQHCSLRLPRQHSDHRDHSHDSIVVLQNACPVSGRLFWPAKTHRVSELKLSHIESTGFPFELA